MQKQNKIYTKTYPTEMWKSVDLHIYFSLYYNGNSSVKSICNVPQYFLSVCWSEVVWTCKNE